MNKAVKDLRLLAGKQNDWSLDRIVAELRAARVQWHISQGHPTETGGRELPSRAAFASDLQYLRGN